MLLAIDVGNTDTKFGVSDGNTWTVWRKPTNDLSDAGEWLSHQFSNTPTLQPLNASILKVGCACVVPSVEQTITNVAKTLFRQEVLFLRATMPFGLKVDYDPPESLGADRFANCLGALKQFSPPIIVVDFGSATTFDVVQENMYIGGAIMPGVKMQAEMLARGTSQLPEAPLIVPDSAIGASTEQAIQAGIVFGHVGAVEGILARIQTECANCATVVATGGLSHLFIGATEAINHFVPNLTLDGIAAALQIS